MPISICRTCAVEQPDSDQPAAICAICSDERQYVRPTGQQWTTLEELAAEGHTGTITEVNTDLADAPERLNEDPYGEGWIFVLTVDDAEQVTRLLDAAAYRALVEG